MIAKPSSLYLSELLNPPRGEVLEAATEEQRADKEHVLKASPGVGSSALQEQPRGP